MQQKIMSVQPKSVCFEFDSGFVRKAIRYRMEKREFGSGFKLRSISIRKITIIDPDRKPETN
jgi:hypothetical protein